MVERNRTDVTFCNCNPTHVSSAHVPANEALSGMARGLAAAHEAYGEKSAIVMFCVQAGETNTVGENWIMAVVVVVVSKSYC